MPIKKSAMARFSSNSAWTLLSLLVFNLQMTTKAFPTNAMLPRIQMDNLKVRLAMRSLQDENRSLGAEQFGPDNFAMQQNSNLSASLKE